MKLVSLPRGLSARLLPAFAAGAFAAPVRAQTEVPLPVQVPTVVVAATRTPDDIRSLGSAVDVVSASDLARLQITTLAGALGSGPGVPAFANGAAGSDISVFTRGSNSDQTLFLVDGIRMNDPNTDYSVTLGGVRLGATDAIEVVRGPQSTLYGAEAVGGVVALQAGKGAGDPAGDVWAEAGSFGTLDGGADAQGARDGWAYSFSASGGHTDNQRANNAFDTDSAVLRIDRTITGEIAVGATLRGFDGRFGDPGDKYTNSTGNHETEGNWLGTVFSDIRLAPDWTMHVILGGQDRRFVAVSVFPGFPASTTVVTNRRGVLDAQTTWSGFERQRITAGITAEDAATADDGYGSIDRRQTLFAAFAEDEWHPIESLYLTGGLRYDDFDTFGSATTGRITAAWLSADKSLKLRASYGTGFSSPSFLELYGVATGYEGNPNLRTEKARGGDAGVDFYLPGNRGSLSASWFRTDYRDLIVYDFSVYPGTTANVGRSRTEGIELEAKLKFSGPFEAEASYTYLQADDLTDGIRLLRRPRSSGSADVWRDLGGGFSAGAGVKAVAGVSDVDALTFATVNDPSYAVARVFAAWAVSRNLTLKARIENALDRKYEPVNGYPALGFGAFGGAEWTF